MKIEMVVDCACKTGEKPLWHPDEERLYWVDIPRGRLFRFDPTAGSYELCYRSDSAIGGYSIQEDGSLLLFQDRGAVNIWRNGRVIPVIRDASTDADGLFNDVIADPEGRVFCGMRGDSQRAGRLYRLDADGQLAKILDNVGEPNGMGFTCDLKGFYFTDSLVGIIYIFDYDRTSGSISRQREFIRVPKKDGVPDGMTVDAGGHVWSAVYGGGYVVRYAPRRNRGDEVQLPCEEDFLLSIRRPRLYRYVCYHRWRR